MMQFSFEIEVEEFDGPSILKGGFALNVGEKRVVCSLPAGHLNSVTATAPLHLAEGEKVFMNGYQSRTYCPEYGARDTMRGYGPLPQSMVDRITNSGDYYFVDYPNRPGQFQGFSYCYFRYHDTYRLIASLDERTGYTFFFYDANEGVLTIQRDCEGLKCNGDFHAFDLFYAVGEENEVFDAWFAAMGVHPATTEKLAGASTGHERGLREQTVHAMLDSCDGILEMDDLFLVDEGWEPMAGDWLEPDETRFPGGMSALSDAIHERGYLAGLSLAPFVVQEGSKLYKAHPEWLLRDGDGNKWSADGATLYALDIDHPDARLYLGQVFGRIFGEWNYDLVKVDLLYAAAPYGSETESRAGRMIRAMELLREWCGYRKLLACGVPLMPAFGIADYCRVGCDVTPDWDDKLHLRLMHRERPSTRHAVGNAVFRRQLNGRAFLSDPDVFYLPDDGRLNPKQRQSLAAADAVFGGLCLFAPDTARRSDPTQYRELRRLREATDAGIYVDGKWQLYCELEGEHYKLTLDNLP